MKQGVLYGHSALQPSAHRLNGQLGLLGCTGKLEWEPQPAAPGTYRAEIDRIASQGSWAKLARHFVAGHICAEITEGITQSDGSRWSHTQSWGSSMPGDVTGNIMVSEDRIRYATNMQTATRLLSTMSFRLWGGLGGRIVNLSGRQLMVRCPLAPSVG